MSVAAILTINNYKLFTGLVCVDLEAFGSKEEGISEADARDRARSRNSRFE